MKLEFRPLTADEIDVRVGTEVKGSGVSLLLYKDARVDMDILDETVGPTNWKREHCRDNANCVVSIWDEEKGQWVPKEDTGTESRTEAEKGLASDSFKRACVNWGIGRELYTSPFVWVTEDYFERNAKGQIKTRFKVQYISTNERKVITGLVIVTNRGEVVFEMNAPKSAKTTVKAPAFQAATPKGEEAPPAPPTPGDEEAPAMSREEMVSTVDRLYTTEQKASMAKLQGVSGIEYLPDEYLTGLMKRLRKAGKIQ